MRKGGFEPPRSCERQPLKLVRLPVPPLPRGGLLRSVILPRAATMAGGLGRSEAAPRYFVCGCCGAFGAGACGAGVAGFGTGRAGVVCTAPPLPDISEDGPRS